MLRYSGGAGPTPGARRSRNTQALWRTGFRLRCVGGGGIGTSFAVLRYAEVADASSSHWRRGQTVFLDRRVTRTARLRAKFLRAASGRFWQGLAKGALGDDLAALQRELTADALQAGGRSAWEVAQRPAVERAQRMLTELADTKSADLAMLSVALRELRHLA